MTGERATYQVSYRTPVATGAAVVAAEGVEAARVEGGRAAAILTGWPAERIAVDAVQDATGATLWVADDQPTPEEWQNGAMGAGSPQDQ